MKFTHIHIVLIVLFVFRYNQQQDAQDKYHPRTRIVWHKANGEETIHDQHAISQEESRAQEGMLIRFSTQHMYDAATQYQHGTTHQTEVDTCSLHPFAERCELIGYHGREGGCNVDEAHHDNTNGKEFDSYNLVHVILFRKRTNFDEVAEWSSS